MESKDQRPQLIHRFEPNKPKYWWFVPILAIALTALGFWISVQCLSLSSECDIGRLDFLWGPFFLFFGVSCFNDLVQEFRMRQAFGKVVLQLQNPPAAPGKPLRLQLLVEREMRQTEQIWFVLVRHDKATSDSQSGAVMALASAQGNDSRHFSVNLPLPEDLKVRRTSEGSAATVSVRIENAMHGSFSWRKIGSRWDLARAFSGRIAWREFILLGEVRLSYEFDIPWQTASGNSQATPVDKSSWIQSGPFNLHGSLSNGSSWKTKNTQNTSDEEGRHMGSFRWESSNTAVPKLFEMHLLPRKQYDNATSQIKQAKESKPGLAQLFELASTLDERRSTTPIALTLRADLSLCILGHDEFDERFAILTNDQARAQNTFNQALATDILDFAELETHHLKVTLQDSTLVVALAYFDFGQEVAEKWTATAVSIAERLIH
jgi:hypothetical protein